MVHSQQVRRVLHFHSRFFERTETFVFSQLIGLRRWEPFLGCRELVNTTEFTSNFKYAGNPFPDVSEPWRFFQRAARRLRIGDLRLQRVLRREHAAVLHAHFGNNGVYAELACNRSRIPLITSFYGYDSALPTSSRGAKWVKGYRRLFQAARWILVEGPSIARRLEDSWKCPAAKIRILRIAIPVTRIKAVFRHPPEHRQTRLLFCGRFIEKKGLPELIRAGAILKSRKCDFRLHIIGDGPQRAEIERMIAEAGLNSVISLLGSQPRDIFWRELEQCDIFVAPSRTSSDGDTEGGAPTVLLEAQAAGVPVVTTNHADIPFVVVPGQSAFIAREGDSESLAVELSKAMAQSSRWAEMGQAGRRHVEQHHDIPVVCNQLESIYDDAAGLSAS